MEEDNGNGCQHHWAINLDNQGICSLCGETKDFMSLQYQDKGWKLIFYPKSTNKKNYVRRYIGVVGKAT